MSAWEYLAQVTRWPHRGSTSAYEREAAQWIGSTLGRLGYRVEIQSFLAPAATLYAGPPLVSLVIASVTLGALWAGSPWARTLAAAVSLAAAALLVQEASLSRPAFDLILPRRPSQNVIAEPLPARGDMAQQPAQGTPTVVITAHYDTQRASWLFAPWFRPALPLFFKAAYGALGLTLASLLAGALAGWWAPAWQPWRWGAWVGLVLVAVFMGFLALAGLFGRPVNGANDNGSGTAVALALAERWAAHPPEGVRLRFLFTGAEEAGTRGMWAYLRTPGAQEPSYIVNIDNVGGGRLRALLNEGMLLPIPCGRRMRRTAERLAAGGQLSLWSRMLLLSTDAGPAAMHRHEVLTFIGLDEGGNIPNYHWFSDMIQHVHRQHLEDVCGTVGAFVEMLACDLRSPALSRVGG